MAFLYAHRAAALPRPSDILFVDEAVYGWRALDEVAVSAYYVGEQDAGRAALERLLAENRFPEKERTRILANGVFYRCG